MKTITNEFECFDVRPLHCNFFLFTTKQELYCAVSTNIMLKIYIITNFHMLHYFDINTCIVTTVSGVKQHSYAAVSYTHLRAHETRGNLVCRLLLEKKKLKHFMKFQKKFSERERK